MRSVWMPLRYHMRRMNSWLDLCFTIGLLMAERCWRSDWAIIWLAAFRWLLDSCGLGRHWWFPVESDFWHFLPTSGKAIWILGKVWRAFPPADLRSRSVALETTRAPKRYNFSNSAIKGENVFAMWGRRLLGACAAGLGLEGATIDIFGMTTVFVPSDLAFTGLDPTKLQRISPTLIPLISHDRSASELHCAS